MSIALRWLDHNMLRRIVIYCLSKYHVATSGMIQIVAKVCMNVTQMRPPEINIL